jgi:hypothetical protein
VVQSGIGYFAFDKDAEELILQGDQLVGLRITDQATRVIRDGEFVRGRSDVVDGIMYSAGIDASAVASHDLSDGEERTLASELIGTGMALDAPTGALYDGPRNRVLVVNYRAGVMAVDLTTLVRTVVLPNMGSDDALPYPRHMYIRPTAGEARVHADGNVIYRSLDLASGAISDRVIPGASVQRVGSIGETAFDADLDLLWVVPSGHRRVVHVIDVVTQDAVIVMR